MKEHEVFFRTIIDYTGNSISQTIECSYHKPIEANESRLVHTVGSASRKLEILDKDRIETKYYKKSRYLPIDFAQSCDSVVKLFSDKTTRDLLLRLDRCNSCLKYMTYVIDTMSSDMGVALYSSDLSDGKSHLSINYTEITPDGIAISDVTLNKLSRQRFKFKDYKKYSEILVTFCDTFVNNLPLAKRIALLGLEVNL